MTRTFAASLAEFLARIPKVVLFGVAALVQIALLVVMIVDRMQILREGTEVTLQTPPVDPRDLLRGDYVVLGYDISQLPAGPLAGQPAGNATPSCSSSSRPIADGLLSRRSRYMPSRRGHGPEVLIRGRVAYGTTCGSSRRAFCDKLQIRYNLESYFVPEGEGRKLEHARNQRKLTVVAAVLPSGRAAIKRLLLDGEPVYEEPWF